MDKQPVDTFMVSPSYVGINLPAGKHEVKAVYTAAPIKTPLLILGLAALALVVVLRRRLEWLPTRLETLRIPRRAAPPPLPQTVDAGHRPDA